MNGERVALVTACIVLAGAAVASSVYALRLRRQLHAGHMRMRTGDHDIGIALPAAKCMHNARARGNSDSSSKSAVTPFEGAMTDDEDDIDANAVADKATDREGNSIALL